MTREAILYYATNRRHRGTDRWNPAGYSAEPSRDGVENLRFGRVIVPFEQERVAKELTRKIDFGTGDGDRLAKYLHSQHGTARIEAFEEDLNKGVSDTKQKKTKFGSTRSFSDLKDSMAAGCDVLVFIHGFNVTWWEAVSSALSLEFMLNRSEQASSRPVRVVLFTWPSDGKTIPYWSYFSDRTDADSSGGAVGRAFLKLRDFLIEARRDSRRSKTEPCRQSLHLLCHSMGNFVLQHALRRMTDFSVGGKPPRIFDQIFLCAPDVADDVFDTDNAFARLPEMAQNVTVYHNREDLAMPVSDYTKGNSDRLGWRGASRPGELDGRVHQVDCTAIVTGAIEHGYYQCGRVNDDIRLSVDQLTPDDPRRNREALRNGWPNVWRLR